MARLRFLIVSGPTREPIDPVRYLSNYSTGTMGRELVRAARARGHQVDWVRCPDDAETARQLLSLLSRRIGRCDVFVMAAAVCDVRPAKVSTSKLKKTSLNRLTLLKNPDVLGALARKKGSGQVFLGFALESDALLANGYAKIRLKKLDLIWIQKVTSKKSAFGETAVEAILLEESKAYRRFPRIEKADAARLLIREAEDAKRALNSKKKRG